jgi:ribonuclease Y
LLIASVILAAIIAAGIGIRAAARRILAQARERSEEIIRDGESQAEIRLKEADLEAQDKTAAAEVQFENQTRKKRQDLRQLEDRLRQQERNLQRRLQLLGQKQQEQDEREKTIAERESSLGEREKQAEALIQERRAQLERLSGATAIQARRELVRDVETEARQEAVHYVRRTEEEARERATERSRQILAESIQRLPTHEWIDNVVTVVRLPNDEMKGRIIGREGRNIRAIEMSTGVDLIVDETPQAIVLSSFDPFRRAMAQTAIERLVEDGRIHPARIEEVVSRARADLEEGLETVGESAAFELGITGLPARVTRLLGKLKFRIVRGYNLLDHSLAVARLGQQMAVLLSVQADVLKRAGLLHEIGQAEEGEAATVHPLAAGADLASKFGEAPAVVEAIRSLQDGVAATTVEAILLECAERAVSARPGERDDNLMVHIERLQTLETIASSFSGVSRAFAMRSGKEVRVMVEAADATDSDVIWLSRDITSRIRNEVRYPGSIRVHVIRETRAVDFAT